MSQYIHFFIRSTDKLLPIYTTSHSSAIYRFYGDYAPYEKVRALSMDELKEIREEISAQVDEWMRRIEESRTNLQMIAAFNNSVEDKMGALEIARDKIREDKEAMWEIENALAFTDFLMNICDEAEDTQYYDKEEAKIDPTKYLYLGVECGVPSIAEIEEWEDSKK